MMSKRGGAELGKIISTFPVLLLIFILIAIYLLLASFAFAFKNPSVPAYLEGLDSFLVDEITIEEKGATIIETLLNIKINEKRCKDIEWRLKGVLGSEDERNQLKKKLVECINYPGKIMDAIKSKIIEDSKSSKERLCLILCSTCSPFAGFKDRSSLDLYFMYKNGEEDWKFIEPKVYSEKKLDKRISFNFESDGKEEEFSLVYYYGKCLEPEEVPK